MKNLLEELRELNNEDTYEVPIDFKIRVMERIEDEQSSSKLRYILPICSAVAVILVAIVIVKGDIFKKEMPDNSENIIVAIAGSDNNINEYRIEETKVAAIPEYSAVNDSVATFDTNLKKSEPLNKEYYDEIIEMLKINNIASEKVENGIRAKGKKEDIEIALYYFLDNVEVIQDGEYVLIKEKQ